MRSEVEESQYSRKCVFMCFGNLSVVRISNGYSIVRSFCCIMYA